MAELNEAESTKDTKKTKKEKKMEEKAAKKAAKKAKKNHEADKPDAENDDSDSVSSKIVMVLVTILIIAIWLGIFAVFVKADVGGFGSTVLAPALKDVPVLSKILPDSGNITALSLQRPQATQIWTMRFRELRSSKSNWMMPIARIRQMPRQSMI